LEGRPTIAVIGGRGDLGSALASRWAAAGYPIVLGSRSKEKAEAAAREMSANHGSAVSGEDNRTAAAKADIVVIAVPYANHDAILNEIKPAVTGKIVVDAVVPLVPPKVSVVQLPPNGCPPAPAASSPSSTMAAHPSSNPAGLSIVTCSCSGTTKRPARW